MCKAVKRNVDAMKMDFLFDILWLVKIIFLAPWKLGGYRHHLLFLNGALLLIIAANTLHVWNYQERILAGNFASIVGKTRRYVCVFFQTCCAIFCLWTGKYCFFVKIWHIRWMKKHQVSLRGGQTCFLMVFHAMSSREFLSVLFLTFFSCPGRMIANSIPARLVAKRMRVALPRACACHCHTHTHGHTVRACTRPYHAHAHGYHMHRAELW